MMCRIELIIRSDVSGDTLEYDIDVVVDGIFIDKSSANIYRHFLCSITIIITGLGCFYQVIRQLRYKRNEKRFVYSQKYFIFGLASSIELQHMM